jgi:hypothetical protein
LLFIETQRSCIYIGSLQKHNCLLVVLSHLDIEQRLLLLFCRGEVGSFLELKQSLVVFANLFRHHYFIAFGFLLDLIKQLLSRLQKNLLKILHIALLSFDRAWLKL